MIELQKIHCEPCLDTMARMPDGFVALTLTSPPYDNLRQYNGYAFEAETIIEQLYRITKDGGTVVWVVGDATVDGSETGSSFRQALTFKAVGFNLWDTMIWRKTNPMPTDSRIPRYSQSFEYMFVFSKGKPICNHLRVPCVNVGVTAHNNYPARRVNGNKSDERIISKTPSVRETRPLHNVWDLPVNDGSSTAHRHPAAFPLILAKNHVYSWSNRGDIVYDPFSGSGTTAVACHELGRRWVGSEISEEYVALANKRLEPYLAQESLFQ